MGGDPWGGDRPGVLDAGVDARVSAVALAYVLEGVMRAGMTFRGLR